jgi:uncharacterized peroxidase-related enzyme
MTFIDTIPVHQAHGAVRELYARQQSHFGYVPNYAKAFSCRPELMKYWAAMQAEIRRHVDRRRFELVTFAAAHSLRNTACALAHGRALTEYHSAGEVQAIATGGPLNELSDADVAMIGFARKVAADASAVTADDAAALRDAGFSDPEIFDIAAIAAARSFFTKLLDGIGCEPDSAFLKIEEPLRTALVVGRPISEQATECLEESL